MKRNIGIGLCILLLFAAVFTVFAPDDTNKILGLILPKTKNKLEKSENNLATRNFNKISQGKQVINPDSPLANPLEDIKASGVDFKINVITKNPQQLQNIARNNLPAKFSVLEQIQTNVEIVGDATWVLQDQISSALDKTSLVNKTLRKAAKAGKPVVFLDHTDINGISTAFESPIKIDKQEHGKNANGGTYKTIATFICYDEEGLPVVGSVTVPSNETNYINEILETTWINRNGAKTIKLNRERVTPASLGAASIDFTYFKKRGYYENYIFDKPYGKINEVYDYYQLLPDGDASYDWFAFDYHTEIVPGYILTSTEYQKYASDIYYEMTYANVYTGQRLYRYGPSTNYSTSDSTASVNIGAQAGVPTGPQVNASFTYTWDIKDLNVLNWSDMSVQKENHKWDFNQQDATGRSTNVINPAINTRVAQGQNGKVSYYRSAYWWLTTSQSGYSGTIYPLCDNYNS